jgi:S1-C subfamily serine protease
MTDGHDDRGVSEPEDLFPAGQEPSGQEPSGPGTSGQGTSGPGTSGPGTSGQGTVPGWAPGYAPPAAAGPGPQSGPQGPGQGGGWNAGWPPPPNWGFPPGWPPAQQGPAGRGSRRRLRLPALATALALVCAFAGAGIGHLLWGTGSTVTAADHGNSASPGSGNSGTGNQPGGYFPFGPGGPGSNGNGSGSAGSGNAGSGNTGTGTPKNAAGSPSDVSAIARKVDPGLVDVNSTFSYQGAAGAGTGIVLTSTGEILTNNHVIDGATKITVTDLGNRRSYPAHVVGYDPIHDMAVLQLQGASGLTTATLGDSAAAKVGEPVVAIGNAGGVGGTPTAAGGSLTGLDKSIIAQDDLDGTNEHLHGLLQTNADVQSGDSGGSLVDAAGQVLGMDTAAEQGFSMQTAANRGYAIPINQALTTARQIEAGQGSADVHVGATAFLGVLITTSSGQTSSGAAAPKGAAIARVVPGGPVAKAGLTGGDVITSLNGHAVTSSSELSRLMITQHPGGTVQLGWTSASGQSHTSSVHLASGPAS